MLQPAATATSLPALIDRAVSALSNARTAAEILDVRDMASVAYDMAKKAARLAKAKEAADTVIKAAYRAQADALDIEASAKRRLADEYDAAQDRGEIAKVGNPNLSGSEKLPSGPDLIPPKELHEARIIRDAEKADPGIVRRTVDEAVERGEEPTKAHVRRAVLQVARPQQVEPARPPRGKEAIRLRVRDAITALSGLPPAYEVAKYFAGTDGAIVVDDHLATAVAWLNDFSNAWSE